MTFPGFICFCFSKQHIFYFGVQMCVCLYSFWYNCRREKHDWLDIFHVYYRASCYQTRHKLIPWNVLIRYSGAGVQDPKNFWDMASYETSELWARLIFWLIVITHSHTHVSKTPTWINRYVCVDELRKDFFISGHSKEMRNKSTISASWQCITFQIFFPTPTRLP